MKFVIVYLIIINALDFLLMLADKLKAKQKCQRIPEAALLGCALFGGSLGCLLGMYIARHKTRKPLFSVGLPILFFIHVAMFFFYFYL